MGQREAARGVRFERLPCDDPQVVVFGIGGSLGPAARPHLSKLFEECQQRRLPRVVLDLSGVLSLGAGGSRQLNEFAAGRAKQGWATAFLVRSATLRSFLCRDPDLQPPPLVDTLEAALSAVGTRGPEQHAPPAQPFPPSPGPARPTAPRSGGLAKPSSPLSGGLTRPTPPLSGGLARPTPPLSGERTKPSFPLSGGTANPSSPLKPTSPRSGGMARPTSPLSGVTKPSFPPSVGPTQPASPLKPTSPL